MSKRIQYLEQDDSIECRILGLRDWTTIITLPLILPFFLIPISMSLDNPDTQIGHGIGMLIWLTIWISVFCSLILGWVWTAFGREIISIHGNILKIRQEILPSLGWCKSFDTSEIRSFTIREPFGPPNLLILQEWGDRGKQERKKYESRGTVGFSYRGKTRVFGQHLYEGEAYAVYKRLIEYLPESARD